MLDYIGDIDAEHAGGEADGRVVRQIMGMVVPGRFVTRSLLGLRADVDRKIVGESDARAVDGDFGVHVVTAREVR